MPKLPVSVLVVVHSAALEVLLLERVARPGYWQSVTGSLERPDEPLAEAAAREVREETGFVATAGDLVRWPLAYTFEIYPEWRGRFAPGTVYNTEHVFSLGLPAPRAPALAPGEHRAWQWRPWQEAAAMCFSWSNRDAIRLLGVHANVVR